MNIFEFTKQNADIISIANIYGIKEKDVCPFHKDSDPSFSLNENKQIFKCFGCGAGGDVIDLVAKLENISKINACKKILKLNNLDYNNSNDNITQYRSQRLHNQKLETLYHNLYKHTIKKINRLKNIRDSFNSYAAVKYISELEMLLDFLDITPKTDEENIVYMKNKIERIEDKWKKIDLTK